MYRRTLAIALGLLAPAAAAHAGLMIELSGAPIPVGPNTQYNYDITFATLSALERIEPGDFVTLYDIATTGPGTTFVSATAGPLWSVAVNNAGPNGPQTLPNDDPNLLN